MNFLDSYREAALHIKDSTARNEFYGAVIDYYYSGHEQEFTSELAEVAFYAVKYTLDTSRERAAAGSKTKSNTEQNENKTKSNTEQNENKRLTKERKGKEYKETVSKETVKKSGKRFSVPSVSEVQAYADSLDNQKYSKKYLFSAQYFCDFYASKGWCVGKDPMKDWKGAVRGWISRKDVQTSEVTSDNGKFAEYV